MYYMFLSRKTSKATKLYSTCMDNVIDIYMYASDC